MGNFPKNNLSKGRGASAVSPGAGGGGGGSGTQSRETHGWLGGQPKDFMKLWGWRDR